MEPAIMIESVNASGTFMAFVEQTETTAYLYIQPHPSLEDRFPLRSCWVRNLKPAPATYNTAAMENGDAPLLPVPNCAHPTGERPFREGELSIVWLMSEDGVALLFNDEVIAIVPGWSLYMDRPVSYATDCVAEIYNMLPLLPDNLLLAQVSQAKEMVEQWSQQDASPWPAMQDYILGSYEQVFGKHQQYFAIDGGNWPPMAIASFDYEDQLIFLTIGVSQRPMPWVDFLYNDTASGYRRMEMGVAVHQSLGKEMAMDLAQGISGLADMPWRKVSWLGEGHTITSNAVKPPYESLILSAALYNGPALPTLVVGGDKVNIYWAQPITLEEREFAHSEANHGYALIEKLIEQDTNWVVMPHRKPVV